MSFVRIFLLIIMFVSLQGCVNQNNLEEKKNENKNNFHRIKIYSVPPFFTFAGEKIPLESPDVREKFDKELHINSYLHSSTILLLKRGKRWLPRISDILTKNGIPEDFKYLPVVESGLENAISHKKAVGFWQLLSTTARENGLIVNNEIDERYDPIKSTYAAIKYLKKAYGKFNNWVDAAASYNRGMRGYENSMKSQKINHFFNLYLNSETTRYVYRILAIKEIFQNPDKYGFDLEEKDYYYPEHLLSYKIENTIPNLTNWALQHKSNYK